ncbi:S41 family peptidase [Alistipes putredinis]|uniref:S41 family peptidase n=1 Tax=Alistipes putredinis TaxID=28117 RepID=UPI003AB0FFED
MNKKHLILRRTAVPAILVLFCTLFWFGKPNDFGLGRNMEILVNMMRELSLFYVDEVDPDQLMQDAAEGMTRNLDPYTEFLPEEQMSNFDLLTTGKYGGIGSMIRKKGDYVIFAQPYESSPADRAGIRIGDKILSIEGEDTKGWDPAQISSALKGTPNTTVRIVIERLIGGEQDTLTLTRERVAIPSVPYAGFVAKGIGYIQHSDFTEGSYEEMRTAIEKLRAQDTLRGLILDYRSNGGGILQEAVKIVSMFVPKGTEVVRTKGRAATQENVFRTANDPILPDLPLAVLINGNSASAAEIVAGSLQDLDRAVLIGQKSFGKGLVQTTRPLGYHTLLKLTTAKYYIPSGRCIQAIDYSSRKQDGTVGKVADSLVREFTTRGGRKVYDGGGISPDIATEPQYISRFAVTLLAMGFIEDFVDEYMQEHHTDTIDNRTFSITDADYDAFVKFMEGKEVPYESETRRVLKVLKEAAENDLYSDLAQEITAIEGDLKDDTQTNLHTYRKEIAETINNDIVLRHSYQAGVIEHNLGDDTEVLRATEVLENPTEYQEITTVQTSEKK